MKKVLLSNLLLISVFSFAQVGINTPNPQGIFHVDPKNNNNETGTPTAVQQADDFIITSNGSIAVGTTVPDASAILELNVNELASSSKKGFLAPRLSLSSRLDTTTIPNPAIGLLVYNLGEVSTFNYDGYVFWNGTEWRALNGSSLADGTLGAITCNGITLVPSTYIAGTPFNGTMNVPYTGGNGGMYPDQTIGPINGLTATLSSGNFANGAGTLSYSITGTPTISSPATTTFSLNIGGKTCAATVGEGDGIAPGDLVYFRTNAISANIEGSGGDNGTQDIGWLSYYQRNLPVIGGKLRLDGYFSDKADGEGTVSFNPRLVNISDNPVRFYFSVLTTINNYNTANIVLPKNSWVNLDDGIYSGHGENNTTSSPTVAPGAGKTSVGQRNTEVVTLDLSVDDKWYRIYYYPIIDNMNTTNTEKDIFINPKIILIIC